MVAELSEAVRAIVKLEFTVFWILYHPELPAAIDEVTVDPQLTEMIENWAKVEQAREKATSTRRAMLMK
jgi:hypothetical protein